MNEKCVKPVACKGSKLKLYAFQPTKPLESTFLTVAPPATVAATKRKLQKCLCENCTSDQVLSCCKHSIKAPQILCIFLQYNVVGIQFFLDI